MALTREPITSNSRFRPRQATILVGIVYAIAVGLMTWPALRFLSQRLIGNNEDTWIFYWNNWWLQKALTSGLNIFDSPYLFYPTGTSLVAHSNSQLNSFLAIILEPFVGPVAAYNLVLLIGLWLGAMGMFWLVRDITRHTLASFMAGFVFTFAPYHLSQSMAHAHLGAIQWWPFFALFVRRALLNGRWRDAVAAGFFAALTLWSGLQLALFVAIWSFIYITWQLWKRREEFIHDPKRINHTAGRVALVVLVALLLSAPILIPILSDWSVLADNVAAFDEGMRKQTDLLSYFVPPIYHPLWGKLFSPLLGRLGVNGIFRPYIGFSVIILASVGVIGWRRETRFWLFSAGFWLLMAAGSALRFNGVIYERLHLPYYWLGTIFPISSIRSPDRFNLLLVMSFAVLAGMGVAYLAKHASWRWASLPLCLLVIIEYIPIPIPMWELPPGSTFVDEMANDGEEYAIVDYPMGYTDSKYWLYYQTLHGKPTVEGHISRYDADTYAFIVNQPVLNALYEVADQAQYLPADFFQNPSSPITAIGPALRNLQESGVRYILVHRTYASESELEHFKYVMPLLPIYEDEVLTVYDLARPRPIHFGRDPVSISPGFDLIQETVRLDEAESNLDIRLLFQKTSPVEEAFICQLQLEGTPSTVYLEPFSSLVDWQPGDLAYHDLRLPIPTDLPPGQYHWQIACPGTTLYMGTASLHVDNQNLTLLDQEINLRFDDGINLNGYRWWVDNSDLNLYLQWQARTDIDRDYKVFVHLIDETGAIVRQYDGLHCNWRCPSSQWTDGQRVADEVTISLWGLPVAEYRLAVGLYDGETGVRLPVRDSAGQQVPEGYTILEQTVKISTG